jgi:O-antigen/teichoic acid export membrane protein
MVIFLSSNLVNAGNLAFNMLFSRWMGPALFADLAVLLTLKLAVLNLAGAAQLAASQMVAAQAGADRNLLVARLARLAWRAFLPGLLLLPLLIALAALGAGQALGLASPASLWILALGFPFALPLALVRGVAAGRLDTGAMVASAQAEMAVRLIGAVLAWQSGLGLNGVMAAILVSIIAGWAVIARPAPRVRPDRAPRAADGMPGRLAAMALPLAVLQLAQVALLDGDVLLAKAMLPAEPAGLAAALGLLQRIQVFACIGLSAVLIPQIAAFAASGRPLLPAVAPVLALVGLASLGLALVAAARPGTLVTLLAGPEFAAAAPLALPTVIGAAAFTLAYLGATCLSAMGRNTGLWLMATAIPLQAAAILLADPATRGLPALIAAKSGCQVALCLAVLSALVLALRRRRDQTS